MEKFDDLINKLKPEEAHLLIKKLEEKFYQKCGVCQRRQKYVKTCEQCQRPKCGGCSPYWTNDECSTCKRDVDFENPWFR